MSSEWGTMIEDVKKYIIGLLDYESRCNLRTCSKSDLALVDSTPFVPETITIQELGSAMLANKTMIRLDVETFTIWFTGKDDVTKVDRAWNEEELADQSERKQESRYDVARRYIDRHFPDGVIAARNISIFNVNLRPSKNWKLKCEGLELFQNTEGYDILWLQQSSGNFRRLTVSPSSDVSLEMTSSLLKTSERLCLDLETNMTDEQLEQVEAVDLRVISSQVTPEAVKKFIERYLKFGKNRDALEFNVRLPENFDYTTLLPRNANFRRKPATEDGSFGGVLFGFQNVNGVRESRDFSVSPSGNYVTISVCVPQQKPLFTAMLWPFTHN